MFQSAITSLHPRHTRSKGTKPPMGVTTKIIGVKQIISKSKDDAHDNDMNEHDAPVSINTKALELYTNSVARITEISGATIEDAAAARLNIFGGGLGACCPPPRCPT